jgi:transcription antitermination factor NusG
VWGQTADVAAEATVPITTDVAENDVVQITAGDFAGMVYEVKQLRRNPLGNKIDVALGYTGQQAAP